MRGNKGFTLIELLAVLVILAIIALITTPIILGVINDSRESAAEDKAWAYVDAVENAFALNQSSDTPTTTFPISGDVTGDVGGQPIRVSGDTAKSGTYSISNEGIITVTDVVIGGYTCSTNSNATKVCCESGEKTDVTCE